VKFLLGENLSPLHARTLRALGHDAVSVVELGLSGADDPVVRDGAIQQERVLVTLDADFANVLRFPPSETPGLCVSVSIRRRRRPSTPLFDWRSPVWPR
jgi:predicted nuclease of predicted toxin-antitoxin system